MKVETININHPLFKKLKIQKISESLFFITPLFSFRKKTYESNGVIMSKNDILNIKKNKCLNNYNISKNCNSYHKILKDLFVSNINKELKGGKSFGCKSFGGKSFGGKSFLNSMDKIISDKFKLSNKESKLNLLKKIAFLFRNGCKTYSTINKDLSGDYRIKIIVEKNDEKIIEIQENIEIDIDNLKIKNKRKISSKQNGGDGYSYNLNQGNIAGMPIIDKYYKCCPPVYCDNTINFMKGGGYYLAVNEPKIDKMSAVNYYPNKTPPVFCDAQKEMTN